MGLLAQYDLSNEPGFKKQVGMSMITAAVLIGGEVKGAQSDVKYSKRQRLATEVLNNPTSLLTQFCLTVAQAGAVSLGGPVAITSSTAAFPSVVTTSAAHGLATGNAVRIQDHTVNTAVNGSNEITVLTTTTFSVPVLGTGAGGATGRVNRLPLDSDIQTTVNAVWDDIAGVTALD